MIPQPIVFFVQPHFPNFIASPPTAMVLQPTTVEESKESSGLQKTRIITTSDQSIIEVTPLPRGKFVPFSVIVLRSFLGF